MVFAWPAYSLLVVDASGIDYTKAVHTHYASFPSALFSLTCHGSLYISSRCQVMCTAFVWRSRASIMLSFCIPQFLQKGK
jgi:hypothetical protein